MYSYGVVLLKLLTGRVPVDTQWPPGQHVLVSWEISTLAVSLLTNALKFYSPATGQYLGECTWHTGSIHEIAFSAPSPPQVICSCYGDGTIRAWDTRSFKQISLLNGGPSLEMFSFSFGGTSGNLLAAGSRSKMLAFHFSSRASRRRSRKKHSSSSLELVQGVMKPLMLFLLEQTEARTWLM